jgi:hypothetical protein
MHRIAAAVVIVVALAAALAGAALAQAATPQSPAGPGHAPPVKPKKKAKKKKQSPAPRKLAHRGRPKTETRNFDVEISGTYERTEKWFSPSTKPEIPPFKGNSSDSLTWSATGTTRVSAYGWPGAWRDLWLMGGDTFHGNVTAFRHTSSSTVPQPDIIGGNTWHSCTATGSHTLAGPSPLSGSLGGNLRPLSLTALVREAQVTAAVTQGGDCPGILPAPSPQVLNLSSTLFGWNIPGDFKRDCYPLGSYKTGWLDSCIITRHEHKDTGGGGYRDIQEDWIIDIALKRR